MRISGLLDCNSFYASCEKVFHPRLADGAVVVLSSNDGNVIARSPEAKALGTPMGEAFYKVRHLVERGELAVFSSNFALYGDMSRRVMSLLHQWMPDVEIYSIDEAFLGARLSSLEELTGPVATFTTHTILPGYPMTHQQSTPVRVLAALAVLLVIPVGLFARSQRAGADPATLPGFLTTYTGDTLWPIVFFFTGRFFFPICNRWRLAAFTLALTLTIEFGQLWQPETLQWLREQPVIGFMLGNSFVWSDVACIIAGCIIAIAVDMVLLIPQKSRGDREN